MRFVGLRAALLRQYVAKGNHTIQKKYNKISYYDLMMLPLLQKKKKNTIRFCKENRIWALISPPTHMASYNNHLNNNNPINKGTKWLKKRKNKTTARKKKRKTLWWLYYLFVVFYFSFCSFGRPLHFVSYKLVFQTFNSKPELNNSIPHS